MLLVGESSSVNALQLIACDGILSSMEVEGMVVLLIFQNYQWRMVF